MGVPAALAAALAACDAPARLAPAVERLGGRYRAGVDDGAPALRDDLDRAAYLHVRMPATAAAVAAAFAALAGACDLEPRSLLDLGSGPGSALWAAVARYPSLSALTAVERDAGIAAAGRALMADAGAPLADCRWVAADLRRLPALEPHDLVVISYALNELTSADRDALIDRLWPLARQALLVVETGTPRGAEVVLQARTRLLAAGATLAAPCPHAGACPLDGRADAWCRFAVRLARSRLHRAAKGGSHGFEDEPFSYLAAVRGPARQAAARIIAPPVVRKDAALLTLCDAAGAAEQAIPRRDPRYAAARRAEWGDRFPPAAPISG